MFGASMRERAGHREARGRAAGRRCENEHIWLVGEGAAARAAAKGRRRREIWRRRGRAVASATQGYGITVLASSGSGRQRRRRPRWHVSRRRRRSVNIVAGAVEDLAHTGLRCFVTGDSRLTPHARDAADASLSQSYNSCKVNYSLSLQSSSRGAGGGRRAARRARRFVCTPGRQGRRGRRLAAIGAR